MNTTHDTRLLTALEQPAPHAHLCAIYESSEERFAVAMPFIRIGLDRGEKCIYVVDDGTEAAVRDAMCAEGIDIERAIATDSLVLLKKEAAYLKHGSFDPEWMFTFWADATAEAMSQGFSALRATGETEWVVRGASGLERWMEYENRLTQMLAHHNCFLLCQYSRQIFPPELVLDVIRTHPTVIYRGAAYRNLYHVPPDELLGTNRAAREVERLLTNIHEREEIEYTLRRQRNELRQRVCQQEADLTARKLTEEANMALEEQLRQSQKMEAVGRLAGGVAHDFNNLLSVVLSYSEMVIADLKEGDPIRDDIEEIRLAGVRAAALTRQLLTFSRQQPIEPKVMDLNDVLSGMDKMLRRLIGEDVELTAIPRASLGRVRIDAGSIEQVIMNLAINARDAMPRGGKLTMETANIVLDEEYVRSHLGAKPGAHVVLSVTDTGTGMDKATLARIFEPFFTTKETGKGTGLGLSTVFGIVQQSAGNVWVYSEPGAGTTFKVYLPRVDATVEESRPQPVPTTLRGSETILLVEDEEQVRDVASGILRRHGYTVLDARNAGEALLLCERHAGPIHLLVSDVVMPHMSGPELAKRLVLARPEMKVLCMSGYTDDATVRDGVIEAAFAYMQKPITVEALTRKVREVLEAKRGSDGGPTET